jgi:hypothetical protein
LRDDTLIKASTLAGNINRAGGAREGTGIRDGNGIELNPDDATSLINSKKENESR